MNNFEFWTELDNIFEAVQAYQKKNIEFNKAFISPWVRLGHVFPREDSTRKDIQAILHVAELDPENAQNWADLGDAFSKMGNLEEAVDAFRKAIELDPTAARPKSNQALALAAQGKYQEAILLYRESLETYTDDQEKAVIWNHLGNVYRKLGDFENAVAAFLRADELDTKASSYRDPMSEMPEPDSIEEYFQGIPDPAIQVTQEPKSTANEFAAKQEEPENMQSCSANLPFDNEFLPQDSISKSTPMEETVPDSSSLMCSSDPANPKVETEINPEKIDDSSTELSPVNFTEQSTSKEPVTNQHNQQQENKTAYEEYLKDFFEPGGMIGDEPTGQPTQAQSVPETRGSDDAKPEFDTQNPDVWNELGNVYFSSGAYDDAIVAYRQAIELEPQFAWAYSNLALAYVQKGRFEEAILLYKRSIELFKNAKEKAISWNRLGNLYRRQQDYDNAIVAYQTADGLDPDNISLWLRSRFSLLGNVNVVEEEPAYIS